RARGARVRAVPAAHRGCARGRGAHAGCLRARVGAAWELSRRKRVRFVVVPPGGERRVHEPPHHAPPRAAGVRDRGPGRAGAAWGRAGIQPRVRARSRAGGRGAAARGAGSLRAVRCRGIWARRNRGADGDRRGDLEGPAVPGAPPVTGDARVMTDHDTPPEFRELRERAARLPKSIVPGRDLWPGIETRIAGTRPGKGEEGRGKRWAPWLLIPLAAAAVLAALLLGRRGALERRGAWEVMRVAGLPLVGSSPLGTTGALQVGQWLETDDSSRAVIL